jgi:hypothetical protein
VKCLKSYTLGKGLMSRIHKELKKELQREKINQLINEPTNWTVLKRSTDGQ